MKDPIDRIIDILVECGYDGNRNHIVEVVLSPPGIATIKYFSDAYSNTSAPLGVVVLSLMYKTQPDEEDGLRVRKV